jgi:hypothetical protein
MSWLVLASEFDESARWVADGLATGSGSVQFVTDADLAGATWSHRVGDRSLSTRVALADGRTIDSDEVRGTFNRLTWVPPAFVEQLVEDDRRYGLQEFSALVMSWLASFPGPIINPPDTRGLSGAWRSPAEWAILAGSAGLNTAPVFFDSANDASAGNGWYATGRNGPFVEDVIVVGDAVFSDADVAPVTADGCRRLAASSATPVLGLAFVGDGMCTVAGVTPMPDLRAGGDAAIDAVAEALGGWCAS